MVGNGLSGYVTTCSVEVADDDYLYYLENPTAFFDTDDNGTRKQLLRSKFPVGNKPVAECCGVDNL